MFYNTTALAVLRQLTKGAIDFNRLIHGTMADLVVIGHKHLHTADDRHDGLFRAPRSLTQIESEDDGRLVTQRRRRDEGADLFCITGQEFWHCPHCATGRGLLTSFARL